MDGVSIAVKKLDIFGARIPSFRMDGKSKVKSHLGGCLTFVIFFTTLCFGALKLQTLLTLHNPQINEYVDRSKFGVNDIYDMREEGFAMAFALETPVNEQPLIDPRYVKWVARYIKHEDGKLVREFSVPLHVCSAQDMAKFYPPSKGSAKHVQHIYEKQDLYCLDFAVHDF